MLRMLFDNEVDILKYMYSSGQSNRDILFYDGNSYNKQIWRQICNFDNLVDNSSKKDLPPDFYSKDDSIMFDVMRIFDSECKVDNSKSDKLRNPVKERERQILREVSRSADGSLDDKVLLSKCESDDYDREHTFENYKNHLDRVVNTHIHKMGIWMEKHPTIKNKGLLLCDETESYFDGDVFTDGKGHFVQKINNPVRIHYPWRDEYFMKHFYNKGLDFVVWYFCYKWNPHLKDYGIKLFPKVVILDVRYAMNDKDFLDYNSVEKFVSF